MKTKGLMMKTTTILLFTFFLLIFTGCSKNENSLNPFSKTQKVYGFSFIEATVLEVFGDKIIVEIEDKDVVVGDSYEDRLTNKIIKSSLLITGMKTYIGKEIAYVDDVRKNQITFKLTKNNLNSGENVKIFIPKKTIAVMDFSLIGVNNKNINKFAMEDMTTKLVQSGQYIVVERTKLDTILKEHKLVDSGLLDQNSATKIGKLVSANIILTGSFAKKANKWHVNLRLVDVTTGIIISAIKEQIDLDEFRPKQSLDSSNITEDFEDKELSQGWIKNLINKKGSKSKATIDTTTAANGTTKSLKIKYYFPRDKSTAILINKRFRDISQYNGIKFLAKAQKETTLSVNLHDQNYDNAYVNRWQYLVNITGDWSEYKVPFNELVLSRRYVRDNPNGDGTLDLDNISSIAFGMNGRSNTKNEKISIWIDEITFY